MMTVKFQQMRYLREAAAHNFNLSEVGRALNASQSVISRQIQLLEAELGFDVLLRRGRRIIGLSSEGEAVLGFARRILMESDDLERFIENRSRRSEPRVTIATTHFHARYTLLEPIVKFRKLHPNIHLKLMQSHPRDIARLIDGEEADLGVSMQSPIELPDVISITHKSVPRIVITSAKHPLLAIHRPTLQQLAKYPFIIYDESFSGGKAIIQAFRDRDLRPTIVLTAMDADVIKAYVGAGLGIAVVQSQVFSARSDTMLRAIDASHLFSPLKIAVTFKGHRRLSQALIDFVSAVVPEVDIANINLKHSR
jgi:DNA-binding transcriptional LysR family regulator